VEIVLDIRIFALKVRCIGSLKVVGPE